MLKGLPASLFESVDQSAFDGLARRTQNDVHSRKYGDLAEWLGRAWKDVHRLRLNQSPPCDILDIGTGPGYFPHACIYAGHRCVALDVPSISPFWRGLHELFDLRVVEHEIRPKQPLPSGLGRFDLITAFRAQFHYSAQEGRVWNLDEWTFFLDDLKDHVLKPNGRVAIRLNAQKHRRGWTMAPPPQSDEALYTFMATRGGTRHGHMVDFAPLL